MIKTSGTQPSTRRHVRKQRAIDVCATKNLLFWLARVSRGGAGRTRLFLDDIHRAIRTAPPVRAAVAALVIFAAVVRMAVAALPAVGLLTVDKLSVSLCHACVVVPQRSEAVSVGVVKGKVVISLGSFDLAFAAAVMLRGATGALRGDCGTHWAAPALATVPNSGHEELPGGWGVSREIEGQLGVSALCKRSNGDNVFKEKETALKDIASSVGLVKVPQVLSCLTSQCCASTREQHRHLALLPSALSSTSDPLRRESEYLCGSISACMACLWQV